MINIIKRIITFLRQTLTAIDNFFDSFINNYDLSPASKKISKIFLWLILIWFLIVPAKIYGELNDNEKSYITEDQNEEPTKQSINTTNYNRKDSMESKRINESAVLNDGLYRYESDYLKTLTSVTVIDVIDGDTVKVDTNEVIRFIGIDTPESVHPEKPVQCFAIEASNKLKETILNQKVYLIADDTQDDKDKYDRLLRYVVLADGTLVNYEMIKQGYAYEYTYQIPYQYQKNFKDAQRFAEEKELGLWGEICKCSAEKDVEVSRECTSCNKATVQYKNFNCTTYPLEVEDLSCSSLCPIVEPQPIYTPPEYTCNCAITCAHLSCSEAQYQLNVCGCQERDGDNDGVACDSKCQ